MESKYPILKFKQTLYSKSALLKAAYNYVDKAYVHLDADDEYYYVELIFKDSAHNTIDQETLENEFTNEMLAQSIRHEVYLQTKNIRELLLARAMATSVIDENIEATDDSVERDFFSEDEILKDWFSQNDKA